MKTTFVLLSHQSDKASIALSADKTNICFERFSILIDANTGDALVEKTMRDPALSGFSQVPSVTLNGENLPDVTHIRPGAEFVVENHRFSYLKPLDVLVAGSKPLPHERFKELAKKMVLAPDFFAKAASTQTRHVNSSSRSMTESIAALLASRSIRWSLLICLSCLGGGIGLRHYSSARDSKTTVSATPSEQAPRKQTTANTADSAAADAEAQPSVALVPSVAPITPAPHSTAPADSTVTKFLPKPSSKPLPRESLSPELRSKIAEYALEARFDPESALRRLEDLKKGLPPGSAGRQEVQKKIDSLR